MRGDLWQFNLSSKEWGWQAGVKVNTDLALSPPPLVSQYLGTALVVG